LHCLVWCSTALLLLSSPGHFACHSPEVSRSPTDLPPAWAVTPARAACDGLSQSSSMWQGSSPKLVKPVMHCTFSTLKYDQVPSSHRHHMPPPPHGSAAARAGGGPGAALPGPGGLLLHVLPAGWRRGRCGARARAGRARAQRRRRPAGGGTAVHSADGAHACGRGRAWERRAAHHLPVQARAGHGRPQLWCARHAC